MRAIPIACADFSFPLLPHDAALTLIAGMGIGAVDISLMVGYSHLDVAEVLRNPDRAGRQLAAKLADKGLMIADINFAPGEDFETLALNHPELRSQQESEEGYRRALDFAAASGAGHMTILPGLHWKSEDEAVSWERCVTELQQRLEQARKAGVVVSIEPHIGSIVPTPTSTRALLDAVPGLTLTLDYTHFIYQGFRDEECSALMPAATHFHARGGAPRRLQTSLKKSTIDYRAVLEKMVEVQYGGYFAIEYVWLDWEGCNETDNVSETMLLLALAKDVIAKA